MILSLNLKDVEIDEQISCAGMDADGVSLARAGCEVCVGHELGYRMRRQNCKSAKKGYAFEFKVVIERNMILRIQVSPSIQK